MISIKRSLKSAIFLLTAATFTVAHNAGCDGTGDPVILPLGDVTAVQLFDETNYTVAFSVESAVLDPSTVAQVNWVFGDGGGFVEGPNDRATMTHRYSAPGTYPVTAYIFGASGYIDSITTDITVVENDDGEEPTPNPNPEDLPGNISAPLPVDDDEDVAVDVELRWSSGILTDSHDVYFGTDETAVADATNDSAEFKGNQEESRYTPEDLQPDTDYFWRIDGINELGTTKGDVLHFTTARPPAKSKNPAPSMGSTSARIDVSLQWTAGSRADSHDVYFGKDQAAVSSATTDDADIFRENTLDTLFDPSDEDAVVEGNLLPDTEYFWRVDEVGSGGVTKGDIWSFRTSPLPPKISMPTPNDGATGVNVEQVLTWVSTPEIEQFDLYLGTDQVDVFEAQRGSPQFQSNLGVTTFDPTELLGSTTYYWRVDSIGKGGTTKGDVFSFTTINPPAQVVGPFTPADDASNESINPQLGWNVGVGGGPTTQFQIYLSESESAVSNRDAGSLISTQDVQFTTFDVEEDSALDADTLHFWRVVAIGPGGRTDGPVLSFITGSQPPVVTGPSPANNAKGVTLDRTLSWSAATGATSYDVYFGTVQADVDNANSDDASFQATVPGTSYNPGPLNGNVQYFWRIDSKGPGGTTKGTLWKFTTVPAAATVPDPFDGEEQVATDTTLSWTTGGGATSHDVYLGTNEAAVEAATHASGGIFQGNQPGTTFTPNDELDGATTYYWRIDEVNIDGTSKGAVWSFTTIAGQASNPVPADGASGVSLTPSLDWTSDPAADSLDVYFGESSTEVAAATTASDEYQGNFPIGAAPPFQPPNVLRGLTFYFWRVDTITPDGTTKGQIWKFRTGPGKASSPVPDNLAIDIDADTTLSWTTGIGAVTQEVYFGTNLSDVTNSDFGTLLGATTRVTVAAPPIDPGALASDTVYYWRVDSVAANGTTRTKGDVWRFTTRGVPAQVASPTPFNGATNIGLNATLNWGAAARAESYDVYFGTSQTDVGSATTASPEFQGNQAGTNYQPTNLLANTTYYWRIDSVNEAGVRTGVVWSFTTAP